MVVPALDTPRFVRPGLLTIALYVLVIVVSSLTMIKPVHGSGTVNLATTYWGGPNGSGYNCNGMASYGAVTGCAQTYYQFRFDSALNSFNNAPPGYYVNAPISCPSPVLTDINWPSPPPPYVGAFHVVYYNINYTYGAFNARYLSCSAPVANDSYVYTKSTCPDHSQTGSPCTCDDSYVPGPDGKNCIPETYTIALSGLGGDDVMPTKTRDAYAKVTKSDGSAKSGAQVTLILTVEPEDDGQPYASHVGSVSPNGGSTGTDGRLNFVFTVPMAGGTHTVHAGCTNCTNVAEGKIKVPGCPVPPLTAPPFNDACAEVLENINSTQAQKDAACGALTDNLKTGMACFSNKLSGLTPAIPLNITSDIRDVAYQAHLRQVWDRMEDVVQWMTDNPTIQTACAARRAEFAAEKGCDNAGGCTSCYAESASQRSHCLAYRPANPSSSDAKHTEGKAFDVSRTRTVDPLQAVLDARTPPQKIPQFLSAPTNCNLSWGGTFDDDVHFYIP